MTDIKVHLLPFSVDREGPINTKSYFKVEQDQNEYNSVMLGRKLVGTAISLADSQAQGHIWEKYDDNMEEAEEEEDEEENQTWTKTNTRIEEFILWKKDTAPNTQDPRMNALSHWIDISQTIHEPIPLPPTQPTTSPSNAS